EVLARLGRVPDALDIARQLKRYLRAKSLAAVAQALGQAGQVGKAKTVLDEAVAAGRQGTTEPWGQAGALLPNTRVLIQTGQEDEAKMVLDEAVAAARQIRTETSSSRTLADIAKEWARLRLYRRARLTCDGCSSVHKLEAHTAILTQYTNAKGASQV